MFHDIAVFPQMKPIGFEYCSEQFKKMNCGVKIYADFKLSLMLTDGLAGVIGEKVYTSKRGDVMFFRPDEIHFGRFLRDGLHRYITILIPCEFVYHFCVGAGCEFLMSPFLDNSQDKLNLLVPDDVSRVAILEISEYLAGLADSITIGTAPPTSDALIFAKLIELLEVCRPLYTAQKLHPPENPTPAVVSKTLFALNNAFPSFAGLDGLAAEVGCSVTYMTRMFRLYTGKTVHGYIADLRLEHARNLLANGATVTEACYESGFGDCSGFIRTFRESFGITPGRYRPPYSDKINRRRP